jgi:hypothetical protein
MKHLLTLFILAYCGAAFSQSHRWFSLERNDKKLVVDTFTQMHLYVMHHRTAKDSVMRRIDGYLTGITKDSLSILVNEYRDQEENSYAHNFYYPDSFIMKIGFADIYKINIENDNASFTAVMVFYSAILSGLVVSPLVSIEDGRINWSRVKLISLSSLGLAIASVFFITTIYHHCPLRAINKNERLWQIKLPD